MRRSAVSLVLRALGVSFLALAALGQGEDGAVSPESGPILSAVTVPVVLDTGDGTARELVVAEGEDGAAAARAFLNAAGMANASDFYDDALRTLVKAVASARGLQAQETKEGAAPEVLPGYPLDVVHVYVTLAEEGPMVRLALREGESTGQASMDFASRYGLEEAAAVQVQQALEREIDARKVGVLGTVQINVEKDDIKINAEEELWSYVPPRIAALRILYKHTTAESVPVELVDEMTGQLEQAMRQYQQGISEAQQQQQSAAAEEVAEAAKERGDGQWVTASLVVAGQAFDLEVPMPAADDVVDQAMFIPMAKGFCEKEWELIGPILASEISPESGVDDCSQVVADLLKTRVQNARSN